MLALLTFPLFSAVPALMPQPAHITFGTGELPIQQGFSISLTGASEPRLQPAANRLIQFLARQTGIPISPDVAHPVLVVSCVAAGEPVQTLEEDESYRLEVTSSGAKLTAPNPLGVLRGFATFAQLVSPSESPLSSGFGVPAVSITDQPRFAWRGLHIDVSRHWMPMDVILRNLDGMAAVKMNVFHWHLSDDQGFRVESKRYPKLHQQGSDGFFYTQDQVRQVVQYARERGIRVVPEFDIPGHSSSWLVGYPDLASGPGSYEIGRHWGIYDPAMDPTQDSVYQFLDNFIGEMAALFPDRYFHIGGDEVNGRQWNASPRITAYKRQHGMLSVDNPDRKQMTEANEKLQAYFNQRLEPIVTKHGKRMMGWDEILAPTLSKNIVIHSWRGQKSLADAVQMGFQGILSSGYYLDHMDSAATHYGIDPLIDPKTKQPLPLSPDEKRRILGGEVCMWSEYVTAENVDSRIWPRSAAIAERFWSPEEVKDVASLYSRLPTVSRQLTKLGLTHQTSYGEMLARLAGSAPLEPLQTLANVVTPVGLGGRARARKYLQQTPLNRLVDAARPESETARYFMDAVEAKDLEAVRLQLEIWKNNAAAFEQLTKKSAILAEAQPISQNLSKAATIGLQALDYLRQKQTAPADWVRRSREFVAGTQTPRAEVQLAVAAPILRLIQFAGAVSQ